MRIGILSLLVVLVAIAFPFGGWGNDAVKVPEAKISFETVKDTDGVVLDMYLNVDHQTLWNLITNPDNMPYLFEKLTLHPVKGFPNRREYHLKSPFGVKKILCELDKNDAEHLLSWKRISGDFVTFYGSWKLLDDSPYKGYVHLKYRSFVDPGGMARLFLTNNRRKSRIIEMSGRLKKLVESTVMQKKTAETAKDIESKKSNKDDAETNK